jgi:hypothetical protein
MSSTGIPAPRLPTPPNEYVAEYFNQIIRALNNYFVQLQNPGPVQATTINVARFDPQTGARTIGLVFSTNNSGNTTASATTISVDDVTGFNATGGYGMIKEATGTNRKYRKFTYTGKTVATPVTLGSNPFAASSGLSTVTVTQTSHGFSAGDYVSFLGATTFAGIPAEQLNAKFSITSITNANSYVISVGAVATSNTSGGGSSVISTAAAGTVTGVVFIAGTSQSYPIHSTVTASALTGDLFYDPFYGHQVYVIQ